MAGEQNYKVFLSFKDEATGKFLKATSDMTASMQKLGITVKKEGSAAAVDIDKMGKGMNEAGRHSRYLGQEIGGLAGKIGSLRNMLLVWFFALRPVIAFTKDAIKEAQNQEIAENKLASAFVRTGKGNSESLKSLISYATQLQMTTGYSDDQIISAQAMLATYKLNEKQIKQVTPLILDMTTAIKRSGDESANLEGTAKMVGRAFQGSTTMLERSGIILSENSKKTKEYGSIVKDIQISVGGAALAMAGTFQGQSKIMGEAFKELKESMGNIITKSPVLASAIKMISDSVLGLTKNIKDSSESSKAWNNIWTSILVVFMAMGAQVKKTWRVFLEFLNIVEITVFKLAEFFSRLLLSAVAAAAAISSLIPGMGKVYDGLKKWGDGLDEFTKNSKATAEAFGKDFERTAKALSGTGEDFLETYNKLISGAEAAAIAQGNQFKSLNGEIEDTSDKVKNNYDAWVEISTSTAKAMRDSMADGFFKVVRGEFDGLMDVVNSFGETVLKMLMQVLATKAMIGIGLGGFLGLAHTGGYIMGAGSFGNVRKFHTGGMSNDEMPAILKRNEGVVNEKGMNSLGVDNLNRLNRGEGAGSGETINNYYIQAIDVKSFRDRLEQHGDIYSNASAANVRNNGVLRKANQRFII